MIKRNSPEKLPENDAPLSCRRFKFYCPRYFSPRMVAQDALLSIHESPPTEPFKDERMEKWIIDKELRNLLRNQLACLGIYRATLFPDLDGLSGYLKWSYQFKDTPHGPYRTSKR